MNQTAIDAPAYRMTYDSLAQWKVERGRDWRDNSWGLILGMCFTPFVILVPFILPFAWYQGHKGKKLEKEGREEGGKGRPYIAPSNPFIGTAPDWERRIDAGVRRWKAPIHPPAYLRP